MCHFDKACPYYANPQEKHHGFIAFFGVDKFCHFFQKEIEIFWGELFVFPTEIQLPSFAILLEKISKLLISQNCPKK